MVHRTIFHNAHMKTNAQEESNHSLTQDSSQQPYLLSERISSVTFFPVNLCLFPILKLRVFRSRLSRREQ